MADPNEPSAKDPFSVRDIPFLRVEHIKCPLKKESVSRKSGISWRKRSCRDGLS
jgi:hypothetical protein